ncbi:MAG: DciA family protein [Snowella sp.]|nr:DciA family protein [Snowella sp.]
MSLNSLDSLLNRLQQQPHWEEYNVYRQALKAWETAIDSKILQYTKPLALRRQVLWIATASSVWAQTLTMQRYTLLKKLNAHLSQPLTDLRFSSAQWHQVQPLNTLQDLEPAAQSDSYQAFLKTLTFPEEEQTPSQTPKEAFQRWTKILQIRAENLPICPQCQSPTFPQELERWSVCANCATQQWR